jgi:ribosomal protein S18 acetylase RimI-like enzyme
VAGQGTWGMPWTLSDDLKEYVATAGGFLRSRPMHHTIQLTAIETLQALGNPANGRNAPLFGWWCPASGEVTAAMMHTPPYGILLTRLPEHSAQPLAEALAARGRRLPSVNAEPDNAAAFAATWTRLAGGTAQEFRRSRLYGLGRLESPAPAAPGTARVAGAADRDVVRSLFAAASEEIGDLADRPVAGLVDERLSLGVVTLWEVDGAAVSVAGVTPPAAGTARVGPVYTPPELRRQGYAGAVTAAASQAALDRGAQHVVLFTDLANPTSNGLYQRLGYRAIEDRVTLSFSS